MSKGHYTGTCAPSSMRTGPGSVKGAGMNKTGGPGKLAMKVSGGKQAGANFSVGGKSTPKGMKYQRSGE